MHKKIDPQLELFLWEPEIVYTNNLYDFTYTLLMLTQIYNKTYTISFYSFTTITIFW